MAPGYAALFALTAAIASAVRAVRDLLLTADMLVRMGKDKPVDFSNRKTVRLGGEGNEN